MSRFSSWGNENVNRSSAVTTSSTSSNPCDASTERTAATRSSGTLAPEVSPTVEAPSSHSGSISLA